MITKDTKKGSIHGIIIGFLCSIFVSAITYYVNPFGNEEFKQKIIGIIILEMEIFAGIGFVLFIVSLVKGWDKIRKKEISDYMSGLIKATTGTFTIIHTVFTYIISEYSDEILAFLQTQNM